MDHFTYQHEGEIHTALVLYFLKEGQECCRIKMPDNTEFVIAPTQVRTAEGNIFWTQTYQNAGHRQSVDLIQALGRGLEEFITNEKF